MSSDTTGPASNLGKRGREDVEEPDLAPDGLTAVEATNDADATARMEESDDEGPMPMPADGNDLAVPAKKRKGAPAFRKQVAELMQISSAST